MFPDEIKGFSPIGEKCRTIAGMGRLKNYVREDVIDNALETFWRKGYSATSLSDLADATGLNRKSLYNEFGSKEGLFDVVLARYRSKKCKQVQLLMREPFGVQNVIDYMEMLVADASVKGCLLCLSINEKDILEQKAARGVQSGFRVLRSLIEKNVAAADQERAKALALLVSSQMFSVAGLGKLRSTKKEIKASFGILIDDVLEPLKHQ